MTWVKYDVLLWHCRFMQWTKQQVLVWRFIFNFTLASPSGQSGLYILYMTLPNTGLDHNLLKIYYKKIIKEKQKINKTDPEYYQKAFQMLDETAFIP